MQNVYELAVLGLADLFIAAGDCRTAGDVAGKQQKEVEAEGDVFHGSLAVAGLVQPDEKSGSRRNGPNEDEEGLQVEHRLALPSAEKKHANQATDKAGSNDGRVVGEVAKQRDSCAEDADEEAKEVHGSGRLLGTLLRHQLGPDARVGFLAQQLPRQLALGVVFSLSRAFGIHVPAPGQALIEVLLVDASHSSKPLAVIGGELVRHDAHLSDSLAHVKRFARVRA